MLNRLISLAVILAIAYFVLTKAGPYLRKQFTVGDSPSASTVDSADASCLDRANQAHDQLITAARSYGQPPVDIARWSDAVWGIESELQTARSVCNCPSEACRAASSALDEMDELLSNLDGMIRGDSPGFANPGHQEEQIQRYLDQARAAVGL